MPPVVGHMIAILLILTLVYYCIKNIRSSSCSGDCSSCSDASTADGRRHAGKGKRSLRTGYRNDLHLFHWVRRRNPYENPLKKPGLNGLQ